MDLVLSSEQRLLRAAANPFFVQRGGVARLRAQRDTPGAPGFDRRTWAAMAELGWLGMLVPEVHGGTALGLAELTLVTEAAGRVLAPEPLVGSAALATSALVVGGDEAQRAAWLPRLCAGGVAALAWDDAPRAGVTARADGDHVILHGEKRDVPAGAEADVLVVSARAEGGATSLWLVDPRAPGVGVTAQRRIDSHPAARVHLDGVRVAADARLPGGADALAAALERGTVALAAELLGSASAAFEMTLRYLHDRQQFGVAIGTFQALRHRAARVYMALELARSSVMAAARTVDGPGGDAIAVGQAVSLAKARVNDAALLAADEAVQMHGGIGMTDEHDIGLYFKRVRVAATTLGDSAWHRDRWARLGGY